MFIIVTFSRMEKIKHQLSVLLYFEELTLTQMGIISYSKGQVQENLFYYLAKHDNAYLLHNNLKKLISIS